MAARAGSPRQRVEVVEVLTALGRTRPRRVLAVPVALPRPRPLVARPPHTLLAVAVRVAPREALALAALAATVAVAILPMARRGLLTVAAVAVVLAVRRVLLPLAAPALSSSRFQTSTLPLSLPE